jgi:DNA-binding response OmpR family regulator
LTVGNLTLDYGNSTVVFQDAQGDKQEISLTNKEFQLLEYFMKHPNQIVTTEQVRNQLWEVCAETVSNVVAAQMRLLRRKLANSGCGNPIETLHGLGYRLNLTHESK